MPPEAERILSGRSPSPPPLPPQKPYPSTPAREGPVAPGNYAAAVAGPRNIFSPAFQRNPKGPTLMSPYPSLYGDAVHFVFDTIPHPSKQAVHEAIGKIGPVIGCSLASHHLHARQVYEVLFNRTEDMKSALTAGIIINNRQYLGRPPRPDNLPQRDTTGQIKINIRNLPTGAPTELEILMKTLSLFGEVELIGFYKDARSGFFEGEGMAIINPVPCSQELTRVVEFPEWKYRPIHFSWIGAPKLCNYCKKEGHLARDCPDIAKTECTTCRRKGHTFRRCPENDPEREEAMSKALVEEEQQQQQQQQTNDSSISSNNNNNNNNINDNNSNNNNSNTDNEDDNNNDRDDEEGSQMDVSEAEPNSDSENEADVFSDSGNPPFQPVQAEGGDGLPVAEDNDVDMQSVEPSVEPDQQKEPHPEPREATRINLDKKRKSAIPPVVGERKSTRETKKPQIYSPSL